jgi:lipoprotein-releasing system ATP-binding protein
MNNTIFELKNISKEYRTKVETIEILKNINFKLNQADFVSIQGKSGSGKTTLLNIIGLLDTPSTGEIKFDDKIINYSDEKIKNMIRNKKIGFVFQFHYLLNEFTALENVMLPALIDKKIDRKQLEIKAKELLDLVELGHRVNHKPLELSGGEKQRVAIARALVNEPNIILADEPTGNLDLETSETISKLFKKINEEKKQTIVIVTHSSELAELTKDKYKIEKGNLKKI